MVQGGLAMDQDIILAMDQDIMAQVGRQDMAQDGLAMDQAMDMVVGGLARHLPRHPLPPPLEAGLTGPSSARDGLLPLLPAQAQAPPPAPAAIPKPKFRPTSMVSRASTTLTTTFTVGATMRTGTWCTSPGASPRAPLPGRTAPASPGP